MNFCQFIVAFFGISLAYFHKKSSVFVWFQPSRTFALCGKFPVENCPAGSKKSRPGWDGSFQTLQSAVLLLKNRGNFLEVVHDGEVLRAALLTLAAGNALRSLAMSLGKVRIVEGLDRKAQVLSTDHCQLTLTLAIRN